MCHEGGFTLAWSADGRLLVIPPPPDWPVPRGERAPTDEQDRLWRTRYERTEPLIRDAIEARAAAQAPPGMLPV